jgi:hypothetical protein
VTARRTALARGAWVAAAVLVLTGCSSFTSAPAASEGTGAGPSASSTPAASTSAGAAPTEATGTASSPDAPTDEADPTDVATDPPVDVAPGDDLDVVVSFAAFQPGSGAVEASGSVPGLVEDGGRCVLVLSRAGRADVSVEGEAFPDAQSTSCDLLSVPVDRLSPGTWTARLDYRSDTSSGSSADVEVVVP